MSEEWLQKPPIIFDRKASLDNVDFIVVSQEPGFWMRTEKAGAEEAIVALQDRESRPSPRSGRRTRSARSSRFSAISIQTGDPIYWTHALKCIPSRSDRDVNKEWRKAATRCEEMFLDEIHLLGKKDLSIIAVGKYALELCLNAFADQDIDQELSISEFMQNNRFPLAYKYKFKDGTVKNISLYVYGNPSSEVVTIKKTGGKMTVEEIQEIETRRIRELLVKGIRREAEPGIAPLEKLKNTLIFLHSSEIFCRRFN